MKQTGRFLLLIVAVGCLAMLWGCVATRADETYRQRLEESRKRAAEPIPEAPNLTGIDKETVARGKALFNGKAACSACHGINGDIKEVSHPSVAKLNPSPTDLREPSDKTARQLTFIIKYGIPGTGMVAMQEKLELQDQDVFAIISYLLALRGQPRPRLAILEELSTANTEADLAIYKICDAQALGYTSMREACVHRLQRQDHALLIGRPPDIPATRYSEIQMSCGQQFGTDLDGLARCYRLQYGVTRQRTR
jgi:mono/diheme cytochrome c family protein